MQIQMRIKLLKLTKMYTKFSSLTTDSNTSCFSLYEYQGGRVGGIENIGNKGLPHCITVTTFN